ncbi:hypothetical protein VTI28DRAFT_6989 [Corynascus sepedonium]
MASPGPAGHAIHEESSPFWLARMAPSYWQPQPQRYPFSANGQTRISHQGAGPFTQGRPSACHGMRAGACSSPRNRSQVSASSVARSRVPVECISNFVALLARSSRSFFPFVEILIETLTKFPSLLTLRDLSARHALQRNRVATSEPCAHSHPSTT